MFLKKIETELLDHPATTLIGIYPKEIKSVKETYVILFLAALFN
jgi:hypothetical protein